jgi:hypothetical protein
LVVGTSVVATSAAILAAATLVVAATPTISVAAVAAGTADVVGMAAVGAADTTVTAGVRASIGVRTTTTMPTTAGISAKTTGIAAGTPTATTEEQERRPPKGPVSFVPPEGAVQGRRRSSLSYVLVWFQERQTDMNWRCGHDDWNAEDQGD